MLVLISENRYVEVYTELADKVGPGSGLSWRSMSSNGEGKGERDRSILTCAL